MSKLYKFLGATVADVLMTDGENFGIKFSHLSDYNDPYEFFLTVDYNQDPHTLAMYREAISMVAKAPATCFAKSPTITPMWAHYTGNSNGFALEIDEDALTEYLKNRTNEQGGGFGFGDIDYQDQPSEQIQSLLMMAARRSKPRDMYFLRTVLSSAAYYTKTTAWSYEQERRLIADELTLETIHGNLILPVPAKCISKILLGQRASPELKNKVLELSNMIGCDVLELIIGRSSITPYFKDIDNTTHIFDGAKIVKSPSNCQKCREPTKNRELCSWCMINQSDEIDAASRNAFRMFHRSGILDNYIAGMDAITFRNKGEPQ